MQGGHDDWDGFSFQTSNVASNNDDSFGEFGSATFVGGNQANDNMFETSEWSTFSSGTTTLQSPNDNINQQPSVTQLDEFSGFSNDLIPTATALPVEDPVNPKPTVPVINLEPLPNLSELQLATGINSLQASTENNATDLQFSTNQISPKVDNMENIMNDFVLIPKSPIQSLPTSPQLSPRASANIPVETNTNDSFGFTSSSSPSTNIFGNGSSEFTVAQTPIETSREEIEFTFDTNVNPNNLDSNINDSASILNDTATTQDMLINDSLDTSVQSLPSEAQVPLTTEPSDVKSLVVQQISLLKENDKTLNVSVDVNIEEANPLISVSEKERESAEEEQRKQAPSVPDQPVVEFDWKAPTFSPGEISLVSMRGRSKQNLRDSFEKKQPVELTNSEDDLAVQASPVTSPRKEDKLHAASPAEAPHSEIEFMGSYPSPLLSPVKRESDLDSVTFDDDSSSATNQDWGNFEQPIQLKQEDQDVFPSHPKHEEDLFQNNQQEEDLFSATKAHDEDIFPSSKPQEDEDIFPAAPVQQTKLDDFDDFGGFETAQPKTDDDDFGNFADSGSTFDADFDVPSTTASVISHPSPVISQPPPVAQPTTTSDSKGPSLFTKSAEEIRHTVVQTLETLNAGQLLANTEAPTQTKLLQDIIAQQAFSNPLPFVTKLEQAARMELTPKRYLQSVGEGGESKRYLSPQTLPAMYASFIESLDIKIIPPEEEIEDAESGLLKPQPVNLNAITTPGTPPLSPLLNKRASHTEIKTAPAAPADVFTAFGELGIQFDGKQKSESATSSNAASPVVSPRVQSTPSSPSSTPRMQPATNVTKSQSAPVVELADFSSFEAFSTPASVVTPTVAPQAPTTSSAPVAVAPAPNHATFTSEATSWNSTSETNTFEVSDFGFAEFTAASTKPPQPEPTPEAFEPTWGSYAGPVTSTISSIPSEMPSLVPTLTASSPTVSPRTTTTQSAPVENDEFSSFVATTTSATTDDDFSSWADFGGATTTTTSSMPDLSSFTVAKPSEATPVPKNTLPMTTEPTEFEVVNPELLPPTQQSSAKAMNTQLADFSSLGGPTQFGSDNTFSTDFTSSSFSVNTDFGATSGLGSAPPTTAFSTDFSSFGTTASPAVPTTSFAVDNNDFTSFTSSTNVNEFGSSFGSTPPTSTLAADFGSSLGTSPVTVNADFGSFSSAAPVVSNPDFGSFGSGSMSTASSLGTSTAVNTDFTSFAAPSSFADLGFGSTSGQTSPTTLESPTSPAFSGSSFAAPLSINTSSTSSDLFRDIGSGMPQQTPSPTVTVVEAPDFDDFGSFVDSSQSASTFDFEQPSSTPKPVSDDDFLGPNSTPSIPTLVAIPTTAPMPTGPSAVLAVSSNSNPIIGSPRSSVDMNPGISIPPLALNKLVSPSQTPKVLSPVQTPKVLSPSQTPKTLSPRSSVDFFPSAFSPTSSFSSTTSQPLDNFGASLPMDTFTNFSKPTSPRSSVDINPAMSRSMSSIDPTKTFSPTSSIDFASLGSVTSKPVSNPISPRASVDNHPMGFINPTMSRSMDSNLTSKPMSPRSSADVPPLGLMNPAPKTSSPRSSIDINQGTNLMMSKPMQQVEIPTAVPISSMPTMTPIAAPISIPTSIPSSVPVNNIPTATSIPTATPVASQAPLIPTAVPVSSSFPTTVAAASSSSLDDFADFQDASSSSFQFEADFEVTHPGAAKPMINNPTNIVQPSSVMTPMTSTSPPSSTLMFPQSPIQPSTPLIPVTPPQLQSKGNTSLLRSSIDILSQPKQQNMGWGTMQGSVPPTSVPTYMGMPAQPQIQAIRPNMTGGSYPTAMPVMMPGAYGLPTQPGAIPLPAQPGAMPLPTQTLPMQPTMGLQPMATTQPGPSLSDYAKSAIPPEQDRAYLGWIGSLSRPESESRLAMVGDGTYLVRWVESHSTYVISCKLNGVVQHLNVIRNVDGRVAVSTTNEVFPNMKECVQSFRSRGFINKPIAI